MSTAKPNTTERTVMDAMHSNYVMADGFLTVADGITLMRLHKASVIIIDRRSEHDELGIVLPSDIAKKVLASNRPAERINLYEIMSKPVLSIRPEMNIRYCARLFDQFGLSLAPIVDSNQQVLGIVDYHQMVLEWLASK
ncbi:CBS domain-containing protein [Vreelandella andesensis]|uniref:CBS domain-containing protein n=1 Tax=Vreelandella andesensis TaxID=447567 RepID=A0A3S0W3S8_9GAMM|nr:CBS domain-containing protein [Halomonas andesensis]RUR27387.1 CBS domain-containing protein [Halomonas andesensis]